MRADLHLHSVYSDGRFTPSQLMKRAKRAGLSLVSVTDHDSMEGENEKRAAAEAAGLRFVNGWEISAYAEGKVHVLGYACRRSSVYDGFLKQRTEGALLRADDMRQKANRALGTDVSMEEIERFHLQKGAPLHTMHVVAAFAERLRTPASVLYPELFVKGKPAYSSLCRPTPIDAIEMIHALGGIAVLAHPVRTGLCGNELETLVNQLVSNGLDGIECHYTTHTVQETEALISFANDRKLLITGGSDFHADDGIHIVGCPKFEPDCRLLDVLSVHGGLQ